MSLPILYHCCFYRQVLVNEVFSDVAESYDRMNDAMSLGIHRIWKDHFIRELKATEDTKLLDVAGGTGDIAFRFLKYCDLHNYQHCQATVCDINVDMLKEGMKRARNSNYFDNIKWIEGNAEMLPFDNDRFNAYTIAFGIRNCTDLDKVLREAFRVLEPGGRFMCLEFSQVENPVAKWVYDKYSFEVIPLLGEFIAGQWRPYRYLVESIRKFPPQETFKKMIENAGFRKVSYQNLTMGVVCIHSGFKL